MDQDELWEEEVTALSRIAAGLTYRRTGSGQGLLGRAVSKPSALDLSTRALVLTWHDTGEYAWSNIDYIGFPPSRQYSGVRPLNKVIWVWLMSGGRAEPQSAAGQLAHMALAIDRRSAGDVLIPNARDIQLDDKCYGGFKQWQLLHLLQEVHTSLTGRTYTNQDFNFGVLKKEAIEPMRTIVAPALMLEMIARLRKLEDEERRVQAAKTLVQAAFHTPNLMPYSAFGI